MEQMSDLSIVTHHVIEKGLLLLPLSILNIFKGPRAGQRARDTNIIVLQKPPHTWLCNNKTSISLVISNINPTACVVAGFTHSQ